MPDRDAVTDITSEYLRMEALEEALRRMPPLVEVLVRLANEGDSRDNRWYARRRNMTEQAAVDVRHARTLLSTTEPDHG